MLLFDVLEIVFQNAARVDTFLFVVRDVVEHMQCRGVLEVRSCVVVVVLDHPTGRAQVGVTRGLWQSHVDRLDHLAGGRVELRKGKRLSCVVRVDRVQNEEVAARLEAATGEQRGQA